MTDRRELFYDLRDANESVHLANKIEMNQKQPLNDHMRKVYKIVVAVHYKQ